MGEYSREEVAAGAAVDLGYVDRVVELGMVVPDGDGRFSTGDVRRVEIVRSLERSGLPLEGLAEAIRRGAITLAFVDQSSYARFAALGGVSFRELSDQSGLSIELLSVLREATGYARPEPDDQVRVDELRAVPLLQVALKQSGRIEPIERMLRAYGDSMRRVADTEADWWRTEVIGPLIAAGIGAGEIGEQTGEFAEAYEKVGDDALLAILHGQQANAWMRNIFDGFEIALAQAGLRSTLEVPPAILFLDLSGYTRLTDERGDAAAADLAGQLSRLVQRTSAPHGGRAVKWLGDGVMFHFRDPRKAVIAALEMVDAAAQSALPPAHVGVHAGPVLFQEGDYFGRTVNAASRIADYARPGEVLVSKEVVEHSAGDGMAFTEIGRVELKGLVGGLVLFSARHADPRPAAAG